MTGIIKPDWLDDFHQRSPLFNPLRSAFQSLEYKASNWPTLEDYQNLINTQPSGISNYLDQPIKFVNQAPSPKKFEDYYESRVYLKGEVQTRLDCWHDFFQVLVWKIFPKTKKILNALHYNASSNRVCNDPNNKQRTAVENFLTLFDECGIIIVSCDNKLLQLIQDFKWKDLFWDNRNQFTKTIDCITFGHAMYEKALTPYIGMTANALLFQVDKAFFTNTLDTKLKILDDMLVAKLENASTLSTSSLNPFPILGVPNWYPENGQLDFYLNENYFRKRRTKKSVENLKSRY